MQDPGVESKQPVPGCRSPAAGQEDTAFPIFARMPVGLRRLVVRSLFYPTLWWNQILHRVLPSRRWWDRVDAHVLLGALPVESLLPSLYVEGVRGVINMCDEFPGSIQSYARMGIEQLYLPTLDFTPPSLADIERGVAFIAAHAEQGKTVYVHCKAGRGRSATIVICWLMKSRGLAPGDAEDEVRKVRPHIARGLWRRAAVEAYYEKLQAER